MCTLLYEASGVLTLKTNWKPSLDQVVLVRCVFKSMQTRLLPGTAASPSDTDIFSHNTACCS